MSHASTPSPSPGPAGTADRADPRPAYEPPRLARKRAVRDATLFTGGSGAPPSTTPPIVAQG